MKRISIQLVWHVLALSLLVGCGGTAAPSASGKDLPTGEEAISMRPTENQPEEYEKDNSEEDRLSVQEQPGEDTDMIQIIVGETTFSASLYDNEAARALAAMLPVTLDMSELNGNEKYCYLNEDLPRAASIPDGIRTGDLMLFGSDCLVLFYKDFPTSYSYTPLGHIDDPEGLAEALGNGSIQVSFKN